MKKTKLLVLAAMLVLLPAIGWGGTPGDGLPGDGIAATAHDFYAGSFYTNTTIGECTFCHTPHKATSTLLLWNHKLSTNPSFSWDVAATTAGTTFPTIKNNYNGPTAKCLSCHDGSVAIGDVYWFSEAGPTDLSKGTKITDAKFQVGASGAMAGNHPVAMPYPYNQGASNYNGTSTGSGFTPNEWQSTPDKNGIRLFTDADGTGTNITAVATAGKTGIECSSCHDPHNKQAVADLFLRGNLTGNDSNYLCLKCHIK